MKIIKGFIKRFLIRLFGKYLKGWSVKKIKNLDLTLLLNLDSYIDYLISLQGYYDEETLNKIHELLERGEDDKQGELLFFDIGSNIGLMSLYIKKKVPSVNIYAFEPISQNFYQNHMNQAINDLPYSLHRVLIGAQKKDFVKVYLGKDHPDQDYGKTNMGTPSIYLRSNNDPESYEVCNMITFDDFWVEFIHPIHHENIRKCVIKIDVEGSELEVISGMENFFRISAGFDVFFVAELLFESMEDTCYKVVDLMANHDYLLHDYADRRVDLSSAITSGNYLFKKVAQ